AGVEARLLEGDLLDLPPLAERFELISMTAVLHWLYPDEERLFRWVARHLDPSSPARRSCVSPTPPNTSVSTPPPSAPISHRWCRRRAWRNSSSASGGSPS
ncbi:class I SAM-dependent methyltransferase, partial [Escherichia coli]|uniref:methyltransferase domain-containing protein n=1 Tax=Escherichia coli TaxID=562 RepID=UPI001BD24CA8